MDKILVVYNSKYGHTEKYAQWLAEELNADICTGKKLNRNLLSDYSTILFGSSLYAGKNEAALLIAEHFEQIKDKKVVLFTCGLADVSNETNIIGINKALDKVLTPVSGKNEKSKAEWQGIAKAAKSRKYFVNKINKSQKRII